MAGVGADTATDPSCACDGDTEGGALLLLLAVVVAGVLQGFDRQIALTALTTLTACAGSDGDLRCGEYTAADGGVGTGFGLDLLACTDLGVHPRDVAPIGITPSLAGGEIEIDTCLLGTDRKSHTNAGAVVAVGAVLLGAVLAGLKR